MMPQCLSRGPAGLCNAVRRLMRTASGIRPLDKSMQRCLDLHTVRDRIQQGSKALCHHSCKSFSCTCAHFQILQQPVVIQLQQSFRLEIHQICRHAGGCRSGFYNSLQVLASSGVQGTLHPKRARLLSPFPCGSGSLHGQLSVRWNPFASFAIDPDGARLLQIPSWLSISSLNL